ncbi:MAG: hypothetical protein HOP19_10050 [Acidobacteria bacterium]|nr:hypothetical protein [Acidobacteriota bacterium]
MKTLYLTLLIMLLAGAAYAQTNPSQNFALAKGQNELGIWFGGSFNSPTLIGTARERKLLLLGLRYGRVLGGSENVAVVYVADVLPIATVFQPDFAPRGNAAVYGASVSPIGFRFVFNRRRRFKPFAETTGGFLYSKRPVPLDLPEATRFNFTFDFGGGVQFFTSSRKAITLGYKFHHLSNAYRSRINPGLDSNVFYVGLSLFK